MAPNSREKDVAVTAGRVKLRGILGLPQEPAGAVAFAHGSGSGRLSPRNSYVARILQAAGIITLMVDLLEVSEELDRRNVFDIDLLAERLLASAKWLRSIPETKGLRLGYFGASTGAAAALEAAALEPEGTAAVVSRGGRPDLAMGYLGRVKAPTLLIVGGEDRPVIAMNREALKNLACEKELVIIPEATHLFPEPGALEKVAELARDWFLRFLVSSAA